jgi:hypothetical protein
MIQYDTNGVTLFYIDANGQRVAAGYTDTERYSTMLTVRGDQQQAALENARVVTNYKAALSAIQGTIDTGRAGQNPDVPTTAPLKPLQKVVSDTGEVNYTPFVPPLADLVIPPTPPPTPAGGMMGALVAAGAAKPDTQAIMYNMILAMFRKMFPDA